MSLIKPQKTLGLVTEYNPFHNGHAYHLKASLALSGADTTVAIMSGYFTQRGEPAIADPFTRAKWAVEAGVDLVLMLPVVFSTASAPMFAFGAIASLDALGAVNALCFGSESGDLEGLKTLTEHLTAIEDDLSTQAKAQANASYNSHRDKLLLERGYVGPSSSNDILGLAYLHALHRLESPIEPLTIKRIQNDYHSKALNTEIASATAVRAGLKASGIDAVSHTIPLCSRQTFEAADFTSPSDALWHQLLLYELRRSSVASLETVHDMPVGMAQRLKAAAAASHSPEAFYKAIQTKAYTNSRLQRVLAKMLLGITKEDLLKDFGTLPTYLRILAFNDAGRALLKASNPSLPLITNAKHYRPDSDIAERQWSLDCYAADLYNLLYQPVKASGEQLRQTPIYIR